MGNSGVKQETEECVHFLFAIPKNLLEHLPVPPNIVSQY